MASTSSVRTLSVGDYERNAYRLPNKNENTKIKGLFTDNVGKDDIFGLDLEELSEIDIDNVEDLKTDSVQMIMAPSMQFGRTVSLPNEEFLECNYISSINL